MADCGLTFWTALAVGLGFGIGVGICVILGFLLWDLIMKSVME